MSQNLKEASKAEFTVPDGTLTYDNLRLAAALRIADSLERIEEPLKKIIRERDQYKQWYENTVKDRDKALHQLRAAKAQITKLRKQLPINQ